LIASAKGASPDARAALEELCRAYWYPLYAFARRKGLSSHDAEELVQAFFAALLERDDLARVDASRGRFRSFLLASLAHFLSHERERARASKRGGDRRALPLDMTVAEERFHREPAHDETPERAFERAWAAEILDRVLARLEDEHRAAGKLALFEGLRDALGAPRGRIDQVSRAAELGLSEEAVRAALHRLRRRYRELLRREIADTVARPEDVEEELADLFRALA